VNGVTCTGLKIAADLRIAMVEAQIYKVISKRIYPKRHCFFKLELEKMSFSVLNKVFLTNRFRETISLLAILNNYLKLNFIT
jgi:hypothetical protein